MKMCRSMYLCGQLSKSSPIIIAQAREEKPSEDSRCELVHDTTLMLE